MKVIIIVDNLDLTMGGGVGSFLYDMSRTMKEKGTDLCFLSVIRNRNDADEMKTDLESRGIPFYCAGARDRKDALIHFVRYTRKMRKIIRAAAGKEETVCSMHLKMGVLYGAVATMGMPSVKCTETYHSQYSHYWLENRVLEKRIALYIACSESAGEEFRERFSPKEGKLITIPNGIRCAEIREKALKGTGKEKHAFQMLSVGRLEKQKNILLTAQAFTSFSGDACYRIIGAGTQEKAIRAACAGSRVVEIEDAKPRQDVLAELLQSDLAVIPSLWEGLSIFLLEAIALGTPLMLSDIPSFRNVFHEKALNPQEEWRLCRWGFLVRTDSGKAYREAAEYFRAREAELRGPMRDALKEYAEENDMSLCAEKYLETFNSLTRKNPDAEKGRRNKAGCGK